MKMINDLRLNDFEAELPADLAEVEETTTAHEVLVEVDRLLRARGLAVAIHEPTIPLPAVRWGFSIVKGDDE